MANETAQYDLFQKYNFITQQFTKYVGSSLYIICLWGAVMNVLTFLQRTYNCRACSLYLLIASTCDFIHLNLGLLSNILQYGFHYNWTVNTIVYCKTISYLVYLFIIISGTLTTLASIDRYMLSSTKSTRWDYSHRSVGIRYIKYTIIFWIISSIPIIFCSQRFRRSSHNGELLCSNSCQDLFCFLVQIMYICLFNGFFPTFIMMIFGILARKNIHCLNRRLRSTRTRRINEQLTIMLVLQSIKSMFACIPYSIFNCYLIVTIDLPKSLIYQAKENLINQIVHLFFWSNYTSFYIYIYSSDIFRGEWIKMMKKIRYRCCRKRERENCHQIKKNISNLC